MRSVGFSRREFLRGAAAMGGAAMGGAAVLGRMGWAESPFELVKTPAPLKWLDPNNGEPAVGGLVQSWLTPVPQFYVRSHGAAPEVGAEDYKVRLVGLVERELTLSLSELTSRYGSTSVMATMQCAGNRRDEFSLVKKVGGVQWGPGAIGNANWTGVSLAAVLAAAGVKDGAKHVQFTGRDSVDLGGEKGAFGASVPLEKALAPETLLAYAMNGELLTKEHGFPLRAVVPGVFGVRSVKWLDTITVSAEESPNFYQQKAYKVMPPTVDEKNVDWKSQKPIQEFILNSAIGTLDVARAGGKATARVQGYAIAPDAVAKVEVTADGGKSWAEAAFVSPEMPYCWRLWEAALPLGADAKSVMVRATSKSGAVQPAVVDWNFKGYCFNGYHSRAI